MWRAQCGPRASSLIRVSWRMNACLIKSLHSNYWLIISHFVFCVENNAQVIKDFFLSGFFCPSPFSGHFWKLLQNKQMAVCWPIIFQVQPRAVSNETARISPPLVARLYALFMFKTLICACLWWKTFPNCWPQGTKLAWCKWLFLLWKTFSTLN